MILERLLILIISIFMMLIFVATLSFLKLVILGLFNFIFGKKLFFEYFIYHTLLLLIIIAILYATNSYGDLKEIVSVAVPTFLIYATLEGIYVYKKYFDYEPKNKYLGFLLVSYVLGFVIFNVLISLLIIIIAAISS